MQFSCDSCKTQLQLADEKIRGKRLIVRCRRCGAKIALADPALPKSAPRVISSGPPPPAPAGAAPAPSAAPQPGPAAETKGPDVEITRAMETEVLERALQASVADNAPQNGAMAPEAAGPVAAPAEGAIWFAMLHGRQTGPLSRAELQARVNEGEVGPRTYLWREGMDSWQRAKDVAELGTMFPTFPGSLLPPNTPVPPAPPPRDPTPPPPERAQQPAATQTWQMGEGVQKADLDEPVPSPPAERGPADVARELFASGEHSISQKNALDLARWATDELGRKRDQAVEQPRMSPPVIAPAPMFESSAPGKRRGMVIVFLGLAALAGTALVLWILLSSTPGGDEEPRRPEPQAQSASAAPAQPPPSTPKAAGPPPPKPPETASPPAAAGAGLSAEQVRRKLDETKPALQVCIDDALRRDPRLRVGRIQVSTTIAPTGQVTAAHIDKQAVDESPLGACLKRVTRRIAFPSFSGAPFDVDIPIVVTAGE